MSLGKAPAVFLFTTLASQTGCAALREAVPVGPFVPVDNDPPTVTLQEVQHDSAPAVLPRSNWTENMPSRDTRNTLSDLHGQCEWVLETPDDVVIHRNTEVDTHVEFFRGDFRCAFSIDDEVFAVSAGRVSVPDHEPNGVQNGVIFNGNVLVGEASQQGYIDGEIDGPARIARANSAMGGEALVAELHRSVSRFMGLLEDFLRKCDITLGGTDSKFPFDWWERVEGEK